MSISSSLSEPRKLRLLQEMGITVYLPRYRLPGAAPSRVVPWPTEKNAAPPSAVPLSIGAPEAIVAPAFMQEPARNHEPVHAQAERNHVVVREEADSNMRRAPKIEVVPHAPATESTPSTAYATPSPKRAVSSANEAETRFQALLFPVASDLAVLTLLPALARQQLQERERLLLHNILRWLGLVEPNLRGPRSFQWPLPNLPGGGLSLAGASLRVFLDQAQREEQGQEKSARVLVFGGLLHEALEADGELRTVHATYSLQELVAVPSLKRECWLSLMPLQQLLAVARTQ